MAWCRWTAALSSNDNNIQGNDSILLRRARPIISGTVFTTLISIHAGIWQRHARRRQRGHHAKHLRRLCELPLLAGVPD
jgi:hypothetical protein